MGRFIILSDELIELTADKPQYVMKFFIAGSKIGSVRYNGPSENALTDKGVYVIAANQENVADDQGGEEVVNITANGLQYLRTTWRVVIVKDTQSNSTDTNITWDQVFSSGDYRDWETDRKSTRLNSSHSAKSRMPSSA